MLLPKAAIFLGLCTFCPVSAKEFPDWLVQGKTANFSRFQF